MNTGNNLLYLLVSALLGFMATSGLLGQQNLQRIEVRFRPGYELYAATACSLEVELYNRRRWLPLFLLRLEIADGEVLIPLLATGGKSQQRIVLSMPLRGMHPLPPIKLTSCFPINFFIRSRIITSNQQLLVFPQSLKCQLPATAGEGRLARQEELSRPGIDGEIRSIDDYRAGDPLKSIHWKLSARHTGYKSKRQNRLGSPAVHLDLMALPGTQEEKLSRCTYLINHLTRQQHSLGLSLGNKSISPVAGRAQRLKLLAELALYGQR